MTSDDDRIRAALSGLREAAPAPGEVDAVLRRHSARRRRPRALRVAAVAAPAAAAAIAAAALLPAGTADRGDTGRSAASLFELAAARAAGQPGAAFDGFRYSRIRQRHSEPQIDARGCKAPGPAVPPVAEGERPAPAPQPQDAGCAQVIGRLVRETVREQWVDAEWRGRRRTDGWRVVEAAPPHADDLGGAADEPYEYGDGPLAEAPLASLPADAARLEATLREAVRTQKWAPDGGGRMAVPPEMVDYELAQTVVHLIAEARISPRLRSAAWGVLSRIDGARATGPARDAAGRRGERVELALAYGAPTAAPSDHRLEVIFDPEAARLLSWSERTTLAGRSHEERTQVIEATGDVLGTSERP